MVSSDADGLDLDSGRLYNVTFDDGTVRLMRKVDPGYRVIGHPWVEVASREVVIVTWPIFHGSKQRKRTRFCCIDDGGLAFGGALVSSMALAVELGDSVSWVNRADVQMGGIVEEVVPINGLPDRERFPRLFRTTRPAIARDHRSFVVRVPSKTVGGAGTFYWPRVSSIFQNF